MCLEAIAALLGHRSMDMTLRYARIANRTVADEYFAVTAQSRSPLRQPTRAARLRGRPEMARLRRESASACSATATAPAPPKLDCRFESVCETCAYFQTSIEFRPTLQAQHDHAAAHGQTSRQDLFAGLLNHLDQAPAS